MRTSLFLFLLLLASALPPSGKAQTTAPDVTAAAASIDQDLRTALDELAALRASIATEKPPLAAETETIAAELREKRRQADLARTSREGAEAEFNKAESDLKTWRDEKLYIESLLLDFRRTWETSKGLATLDQPGQPSPADAATANPALASLIIEDLRRGGSVATFEGEAVAGDGRLVPGTFAKAGPVHWFLSNDQSLSGLVGEGSDLRPRVVNDSIPSAAIEALIQGKPATLAFDPTMGSAVALSETETDFFTHVKQGGFWVIPILLLAFIALVTAIFKWAQLAKIREFSAASVQKVLGALNDGRPAEAMTAAATIHHPARALLERGITVVSENHKVSRDDVEEALFEKFLEATPRLQRGLPLIAIASATAPLLGLLGTVTGMMETFRLITVFGTGDAKSLASGISEALITTEFGLVVAIPALIAHSLLSRKIQGIKSVMEMTSLAFLNGIKNP
jgi:biopolymer transport protein ExbB